MGGFKIEIFHWVNMFLNTICIVFNVVLMGYEFKLIFMLTLNDRNNKQKTIYFYMFLMICVTLTIVRNKRFKTQTA